MAVGAPADRRTMGQRQRAAVGADTLTSVIKKNSIG